MAERVYQAALQLVHCALVAALPEERCAEVGQPIHEGCGRQAAVGGPRQSALRRRGHLTKDVSLST